MKQKLFVATGELEQCEGTVESIPFSHDDSYILRLRLNDNSKISAVIDYGLLLGPPIVVGEHLKLKGEFKYSMQFGDQLYTVEVNRKTINSSSNLVKEWIARDRNIPGVGIASAQKLVSTYGNKLIGILNRQDVEQIMSDTGIHPTKIITLIAAWKKYDQELRTINYLVESSFLMLFPKNVISAWGDNCREILERDPYYLSAFLPFEKLDTFVQTNWNICKNDQRRLVACAEDILYRSYQEGGNTAMSANDLDTKLRQKTKYGIDTITDSQDAFYVHENGLVQSTGAFIMESYVELRLNEIARTRLFPRTFSEEKLEYYQHYSGFPLHANQINAIKNSVINPVSIIQGGAGTGKTTVIEAIIEQYRDTEREVVLLAPTGKAALRMREATGRNSQTICKFVSETTRFGRTSHYQGAIIIVDESSMIDLPTMYSLLSSIPNNINLIMVGDNRQLPPIGAGLVFQLLVKQNWIPQAKLTVTQRQKLTAGIPDMAQKILDYEVPEFEPMKKIMFEGVSFKHDSDLQSTITNAAKLYVAIHSRIGDSINYDLQLIADTKATVAELNKEVQNMLNPISGDDYVTKAIYQPDKTMFVAGDKVVFNENNYEKNLTNGVVGTVLEVYPQGKFYGVSGEVVKYAIKIKFEDIEDDVYLTETEFYTQKISLAYAVTAHKSQGSQFHTTIIVANSTYLVDNSWIYTAITRAKHACYLLGDEEVFRNGIKTETQALKRLTGVAFAKHH
ncbi:RecD/TraA family predicted helicase [Vibrio sp. ES.051]|uniref:ATP-dependent DNA helicase n=1 Tax=Vibrio sp. ES.051 TaxID=1761909 RepID=UPI000BF9C411|nr:AAA family ATPase [Vibrio sp. ES.051]PFG45754.1 RecD/TraA family predicted helicase [Vibrio sp. ES.051]